MLLTDLPDDVIVGLVIKRLPVDAWQSLRGTCSRLLMLSGDRGVCESVLVQLGFEARSLTAKSSVEVKELALKMAGEYALVKAGCESLRESQLHCGPGLPMEQVLHHEARIRDHVKHLAEEMLGMGQEEVERVGELFRLRMMYSLLDGACLHPDKIELFTLHPLSPMDTPLKLDTWLFEHLSDEAEKENALLWPPLVSDGDFDQLLLCCDPRSQDFGRIELWTRPIPEFQAGPADVKDLLRFTADFLIKNPEYDHQVNTSELFESLFEELE